MYDLLYVNNNKNHSIDFPCVSDSFEYLPVMLIISSTFQQQYKSR